MTWRLAATALFLFLPAMSGADIRITEIMYDASGSDTKREWVEIQNSGASAVDISGWKFVDKSNHVLNAPPKNGGVGSLVIQPGAYAVIASDATTFLSAYPSVATVIDTVMSLNNTGAMISLTGSSSVSASYTRELGAAGTGDSLQLAGSTWIHAKSTPGAPNATIPSAPKIAAPSPKPVAKKPIEKSVSIAAAEATEESLDDAPEAVLQEAAMQVASAESASSYLWWFAAAALAIGTAATAAVITRTKKDEWQIEEAE